MTEPFVVRREYHLDAPRLDTFVGDTGSYLSDDIYRRVRSFTPAPGASDSIRRGAPWADADRLWELTLERGLRAPGFRMVRGGATLTRADYCRAAGVGNRQLDDLVEPNRVLELFDEGATLVLQGLQHIDGPFARLSTNLALELDQPVQVNAYLSPNEARGLDLHFDYHDVIVAQLAGSKRWRVWEPLERTRRPVKSGRAIPLPRLDELGEPLLDVTLGAGDCVSVPRGFPHAAETVDDESAHLTIGIMAITWERLLRRLLRDESAHTALADRLPPAALDSRYDPSDALAAVVTGLTTERLRATVADEVWRRQPRTRLRPRRAVDADLDEPVRVTPGPLLWLTGDDDVARLHLGDRRLVIPDDARQLVTGVLESAGPFAAGDIRGPLDAESALVVVSRLVAEGVLVSG